MIFKSIRWRLQIWYGVILLAVLAGFGVTAYQLERGRQFRRIDDELRRRGNMIANALRLPPPRRAGPDGPPFARPLPGAPEPGMPEGPRRGRPFEEGPDAGAGPRFSGEPDLQARLANQFDETDTNGFYYVVFSRDGKELRRSTNAPAGVKPPEGRMPGPPEDSGPDAVLPRRSPLRQPPLIRTRESFRETVLFNPRLQEAIVVGRSLAVELSDLRRTAFILTAVGGAILLVGLAGGWWLAGRAIRPVQDITVAAQKISGSDLSQRIDVAETESELGRLASVLNSTFARLDAAFAQQQQFTSDAAHELRTPVSVMLTQIQSALARDRSAPEYRETIEACQRSVQRMRRLIESLLELARLDAGQETMKRMTFDLARTAADAIELVRPLAESRRLEIRSELASAACVGDPERFGQVVTNLLTNAVNYNRENGSVRIETGREGDFAFVRVSDDGPGIAPEHLPHIFERFYRADSSRTVGWGGAGLGLAISKAVIEAHSGTIEVTSEVGRGTVFTVRIPG